jgi:hypothetical protein
MKLPMLFKCCTAEHNEGSTKIIVKSRCFEKPIVFNITNDINPEELIKDIVMRMTKATDPPVSPEPVNQASVADV